MTFQEIPMNAARICDGLSHIGYTPYSAITDIMDNSAQAGAKNIHVLIIRDTPMSDARLNNVREYIVIDDGYGMSPDGILQALQLGSPSDNYSQNSLSKFGLGLKSASFSQGEVLEVISAQSNFAFTKYVVSLPRVRSTGLYGAESKDLTDEDVELIKKYLPNGYGTLVRVGEVRKVNHPSVRSTLKELHKRVGVIYYYMMKNGNLRIFVDGQECLPFDALFTEEADRNGNLDENDWDGRTTRWIQRATKLTLDSDANVVATIEVTQLPHPPTFELDGVSKVEIRDKYMIDANNYGFYVYRNNRLLSWAELFDIIPRDQDYYAFRGRIIIDDTADDVFNIDVKKSHLMLSDEAYRALEEASEEYKRKSKKAWKHAGDEIKRITNEDPISKTNDILQQIELPEELPGTSDTESDYVEAQQRQSELLEDQEQRMKELVHAVVDTDGSEDESGEQLAPTSEQFQQVVIGETASRHDRIFLVKVTEDNTLWEPYYDAEKGACVRINRMHRFARAIYEDNSHNNALIFFFGALILQLANSETYIQKRLTRYPREQISAITQEFRRVASEYLAELCRQIPVLPSDDNSKML